MSGTFKDPGFIGPVETKNRLQSYLGKSENEYFKGEIDEFRVYNRILSENEILCLSQKSGCNLTILL